MRAWQWGRRLAGLNFRLSKTKVAVALAWVVSTEF